MKFLLTALNAKYIHSNPALYSLRAYAKKYEEHIGLYEFTINQQQEEILAKIYKLKPDVIGFSCYIWNIKMILEVVEELHKIMPALPIWLGGPEVSYNSEELLSKYDGISGIMIGEGEATFLDLMSYYVEKKKALQDIAGIAFRQEDGTYKITEQRALTDLSDLPFLYENLDEFKNKIIYYETSRGCPFRCSYCMSSIDKSIRLRDISIVKKELKFFLEQKVKQVKFIDRTFNCNKKHAMEIWKYIKENDNGITNFHFEIAADLLGEDELELLATMRTGAVQMEIGVQTTHVETIHEIRRVMDVDRVSKVVEALRKPKNIHIHLDLIAGLPYENYERFAQSFCDVYEMEPEQLQLGFLKVLKGSYMMEQAKEYGLVYKNTPPYEVLYTNWLSFSDVCKLKQVEEMVELYYNSNQFFNTLKFCVPLFQSPFVFFEKLSQFYDENGYFMNSPARTYRYQVLLDFMEKEYCQNDIEKVSLIKQLLVLDIYTRENAKSRPEFSKEDQRTKECMLEFCRKEVANRQDGIELLPEYGEYDARALIRMLHLEALYFDVMGETPTYQKMTRECYLLFDYKSRDKKTYDARTIFLDWSEYEEKNAGNT